MTEAKPLALVVDDEVQIRRFLRARLWSSTASPSRTPRPPTKRCAWRPSRRRTSSSSILDCRTWTGAKCWSGCAAGPACRSSCFRCARTKRKRCGSWKAGRTTTSSNPSEWRSFWRALTPPCGVTCASRPASRWSRSVRWRLIWLRASSPLTDRAWGSRRKSTGCLQLLAQHAGNVVTHQFLLKEVWGSPHLNDTHYLRIFMRKLRQKIEADPTQPRMLLTELGVGYRLVAPETAAPAPSRRRAG